jgi:hypothetical protein
MNGRKLGNGAVQVWSTLQKVLLNRDYGGTLNLFVCVFL